MRCFHARSENRSVASICAPRIARALLVVGLVGCGGLDPVGTYNETISDPTQLFSSVTLDYTALTLSTAPGYNTWQLTATPRNALGEALAGLPAATFRSTDTNRVHVTPEGLLTARNAGTLVRIIAEVAAPGNVRHVDTATVNVTTLTSPPILDSISVDPAPPDSAMWQINTPFVDGAAGTILELLGGLNLTPTLRPRAWNTAGGAITGLPYEYSILDPEPVNPTLTLTSNRQTATVKLLRPGQVRFAIRTTMYGVTRVDTATFTATLPSKGDIVARSNESGATIFTPSEVRIRPNGIVFWNNLLNREVDVVFDDTTHVVQVPASLCTLVQQFGSVLHIDPPYCASGNFVIKAVLPDSSSVPSLQYRQFPVPGVYNFHSTQTGATGRVVVVDVAP